ncbi:Eco57I restriction-modification methylase domain-containing protein [Mycobacterium botniense]|uniref:Eco57I restriction-modification methylase domain-containing protein n=1 Tax=Mycobacterium botniense TaxID=84962 RepID=UPI0013CFB19F|nr:N-6 DNA methylase [Mycobacterium botniense]
MTVVGSDAPGAGAIDVLLASWFATANSACPSKLESVASLFGKKKVRGLAQKVDTKDIAWCIDLIQTWLDDYRRGSLKGDNETSREQAYNQDFFIKILGYREKPHVPFTFTPKAATTAKGGQTPDAVLRYAEPVAGIDNIAAVVELKGADVSLDKPQQSQGNLSPVQQGFKYKPQFASCPFVVVSNFYEFRLYNDNQLDFERWTLDDLIDPTDDYLKFKTWYVLMRAESMVSRQGPSATQALLSAIRQEQEEVGEQFYAEYKDIRIELLQDIWRNNPATRDKFDLAIRKAQTIIDRVVFACFAEDMDLLPDQIVATVLNHAENHNPLGEPLFEFFKRLFRSIDKGSAALGIPVGYNGGLFAEDPWIDALTISDPVMRKLAGLSRYDFRNELRVNVLGHIFEQSITNLEEIRRKVRAEKNPLGLKSRRRREGIYYTPDYIVRFIVDNTLGAYLRLREDELKRKHKLNLMKTEEGYDKRQRRMYSEYLAVLQAIKVVDIACGSGAFLVYVFDYLLKENLRVNEILGGTLMSYDEVVRKILSDNIFGVDINEESVEITKLSLWLKTAEKGKPLTALDNNIKCGNSLVDDPDQGGSKAFNWRDNFPDIMASGGFDVVIGNPPYINARLMTQDERAHLVEKYPQLAGSYDIYVAFLLRGIQLLKPEGRYGWIIPNKYLIADYARPAQEFMSGSSLESVVNVSTLSVFKGVGVYPIILLGNMNRSESATVERYSISEPEHLGNFTQYPDEGNGLRRFKTLADFGIKLNAGTTGFEAQVVKGLLNEAGSGIPFAVSGGVDPFQIDTTRVPYMKSVYKHPYITLGSPEIAASKYAFWKAPKVVIAGMTKRIEAVYVPEPLALGVGAYGIYDFGGIDPEALTAVLNSAFMSYYLRTEFADKHLAGGYLAINKSNIEQLPMVRISRKDQADLADLAHSVAKSLANLRERSEHVLTVMKSEYGGQNWNARKLKTWWRLDFDEFLAAARLRLSLTQKDELLTYFNKTAAECAAFENQAVAAQREIDEIVYRLYRITDEERALIEAIEVAEEPLDSLLDD